MKPETITRFKKAHSAVDIAIHGATAMIRCAARKGWSESALATTQKRTGWQITRCGCDLNGFYLVAKQVSVDNA